MFNVFTSILFHQNIRTLRNRNIFLHFHRCILGVLGTLVVIGTIYDVIAIQLTSETSNPPVLISALPTESPPPYMAFNGMPNEGVANGAYEVTENKKEKYVISSSASNSIVSEPPKVVNQIAEGKGQTQPNSK